jgi:hypothetical protein
MRERHPTGERNDDSTPLAVTGGKLMKHILIALFLTTSAFAQNQSVILAAACGNAKVSFEVTEDSSDHALPQPEPGKALVYFIQDDGPDGDRQHYTVRIGLDGAWAGAYKSNSWFAVPVEPGEHHVCANVQSNSSAALNVALAHFTAEPGKVYYFRTRFLAGLATLYPIHPYLALDQPDSDQARYLIALFPLSGAQPTNSQPKKK